MRVGVEKRFAKKYQVVTETGCWIWTGHMHEHGYGRFSFRGKHWRAHRVSWVLHVGEIPEGKLVMHLCDVRCCVNPAHLTVGTNDENMADMVKKGRQAKGRKINVGKFDAEQIREIRADPRSTRKIGKDYGVCGTAIGKIKSKLTYRWVSDC